MDKTKQYFLGAIQSFHPWIKMTVYFKSKKETFTSSPILNPLSPSQTEITTLQKKNVQLKLNDWIQYKVFF